MHLTAPIVCKIQPSVHNFTSINNTANSKIKSMKSTKNLNSAIILGTTIVLLDN